MEAQKEVAKEWEAMGEITELNSDGPIDQLEDLRFEMKSQKSNFSSSKCEKISENETHGVRKEIPQEETFSKYGDAARKVEIEAIGKHGALMGDTFLGNSGRRVFD